MFAFSNSYTHGNFTLTRQIIAERILPSMKLVEYYFLRMRKSCFTCFPKLYIF